MPLSLVISIFYTRTLAIRYFLVTVDTFTYATHIGDLSILHSQTNILCRLETIRQYLQLSYFLLYTKVHLVTLVLHAMYN